MIHYIESINGVGVGVEHLRGGFFYKWPNPPTPENHLRILRGSDVVVLAREADDNIVGFITAVSDGVSCAYIPHLEVLRAYQGNGIGTELMQRMLAKLRHLYMVDLVCDLSVRTFYDRLGMRAVVGMVARNYDRQACE